MKVNKSGFRSQRGKEAFRNWYEGILEEASTEYTCRYVETRFGKTHVASSECAANRNAPALIFLHGWSGNGMLWEVTNDLAEVSKRYRTYLVDVIGQPGHSSQLSPMLKRTGYGDWLVDVLNALGLETARFVGMSFGCMLLVKLAQVAPERMERVALISPAGLSGIRKKPLNLYYFLAPRLNPSEANLTRFVRKMIIGPGSGLPETTVSKMAGLFEISFKHHKPGAELPFVLADAEWKALSMPSMVLAGEHDQLFEAEKVLSRAKKVLPNLLAAEKLPGLGHAMEDYPLLSKRIGKFISGEM